MSAPAGYGKTTLVRTWHKGREERTAWYSIDEGANERLAALDSRLAGPPGGASKASAPFRGEAETIPPGRECAVVAAVRCLAARICPGDAPRARGIDPDSEAARPARGSMDDLVEPLSPREIEILACVGRGLSNEETGEELFISAGTVKWHMGNIFGKLGVGNRTFAAAVAREMGLI